MSVQHGIEHRWFAVNRCLCSLVRDELEDRAECSGGCLLPEVNKPDDML